MKFHIDLHCLKSDGHPILVTSLQDTTALTVYSDSNFLIQLQSLNMSMTITCARAGTTNSSTMRPSGPECSRPESHLKTGKGKTVCGRVFISQQTLTPPDPDPAPLRQPPNQDDNSDNLTDIYEDPPNPPDNLGSPLDPEGPSGGDPPDDPDDDLNPHGNPEGNPLDNQPDMSMVQTMQFLAKTLQSANTMGVPKFR